MEPNGLACGDEDGEDRISQLPDPLLHHIISLSSMTTREVVQSTSTLSKRWKNLWASMPFLSFYHYEFYKRDEEDDEEQGKGRFERFVNAVLLLRDKSDVQKFQLRWTRLISSCTKRHFATWIQYAANHNVKSLDIKVDLDVNIFTLPHFIFNCRYLEELKLGFVCIYVDIIPPKFMGLGRLRKLPLNHFDINRDSLQKLLSGCPVLEELQFTKGMLREPDISSKVLKRLTVRKCSIKGTVIRISSPSLMYLSFICNDIERSQVRLENLSSLVEASFQTDDYAGEDLYEQIPETIKFIESIPGKERDKTFHNLKKLELFAESMSANFHAVTHLLQRSPNLEKLKLCHVEYGEPTEGKELSWVFDCPHLYMDIQIQCDKFSWRTQHYWASCLFKPVLIMVLHLGHGCSVDTVSIIMISASRLRYTPCHSLNQDFNEMLRSRTSRARQHTMVLILFTIRQMVQTLSSSLA